MNSRKRNWIAIAGIGLGVMMPLKVAFAAADSDALRNLTAEWWQWAYSIPTNENPTLDATGEDCSLGQRGSTWFLAGTSGGGPAVRNCSVPEGKEIFFPVANITYLNTPNVCGQGPQDIPVGEMRAAIAGLIDGVTKRAAQIDGRPLRLRRVQSRVFDITLPEDNLFDAPCAELGGQPGGIFSPAVDDGYYVRLHPLSVGEHTLHVHAENPEIEFLLDVTYHLTVVPVSLRARRGD